jgi:hypothetical protein
MQGYKVKEKTAIVPQHLCAKIEKYTFTDLVSIQEGFI